LQKIKYYIIEVYKKKSVMETNNKDSIQQQFLKKIEDIIPSNSSLVYELSDALDVSNDSAYRRIRGETALSIGDVIKLCDHFKISFDSFSHSESGRVTFSYTKMNKEEHSFEEYLSSMISDLKIINSAKDSMIIYAAEDIPIFHNYRYPVLSAFKMFYWMKSIMNISSLENKKFDSSKISDKMKDLGKQIIALYTSTPSVEIWTDSTIQSAIKQIGFYWDSGMFSSAEDAIMVCSELKLAISDIQKQAELGTKFISEEMKNVNKGNYSVYFSEIEVTNNCVLVSLGNTKQVYLGHQTFNTMATANINYCNEIEQWLNNIIKKSTLISGISETHRYQFFRKALNAIDGLINKINES